MNKHIKRVAAVALGLILSSVLIACGGQHSSAPTSLPTEIVTPQLDPGAQWMPEFPGSRKASGLLLASKPGAQFDAASAGASVKSDSALTINASASHGEYAMYSYDATLGAPPAVGVLFETNQTSAAWVAIANYTTQRWEFTGPYSNSAEVKLGADNYVSPSHAVWAAVIVPAGEHALVRDVTFGTFQTGDVPPSSQFSLSVDGPTYPQKITVQAAANTDPDGTVIEYAWDWEGDGIYDYFTTQTTVLEHIYTVPGTYRVWLRVSDDQFAQIGHSMLVDYVNLLPSAQLTAPTPSADPSTVVSLDASGSSDADGTIAHYAWDLDGDGVFGEAGIEAAAADSATTSVTLGAQPGPQQVSVKVTDNLGGEAQAGLTLTARGWLIRSVDTAQGCILPTLATVGGVPAVAYQCNVAQEVRYAVNSRTDGLGSWSHVGIATNGETFYRPCVIDAGAVPGISYVNTTTQKLEYTLNTAADGSGTWTTVHVDASGNVNGFNSLARLDAGGLGISYYDKLNGDLRYAYTATADGSAGWQTLAVDAAADDAGGYSALAMIGGKPAIAYTDVTTHGLNFAYSSQPDGSSGWTSVTVLGAGTDTMVGNLLTIGGQPAFAFSDANSPGYAYCPQADGSSGWSTVMVDPLKTGDPLVALGMQGGLPFMAYGIGGLSTDLYVSRCTNLDGSGTWTPVLTDSDMLSVAAGMVDGHQALVYAHGFVSGGLACAILYE